MSPTNTFGHQHYGWAKRAASRQLKVQEKRNEDSGTYLNTNTSDDHEYQVLIFPDPVSDFIFCCHQTLVTRDPWVGSE